MDELRLFISHKHSDRDIAEVVANFIENRSNGQVKVYLSSSPDFQGPRYGPNLNAQLRDALSKSDVLILIYTTADNDWQYCMWECGFASRPSTPPTNIVIFQCGSDVPVPFQDVLRVKVTNPDDLKRFADQFLRDKGFFPSAGHALAPALRDSYIDEAAQDLHQKLLLVLPEPPTSADEWSAWPFLKIELPSSQADKLALASEGTRLKLAQQIVRDHANIVESDSRAPQLFGMGGFPADMKFELLLNLWKGSYPDLDATWFDSCCEQIAVGAARGFPIIRWAPLRQVGGDSEFTPVLSRIKRVPYGSVAHFNLYFYNLSDPRGIPVIDEMIRIGAFFYKTLGSEAAEAFSLKGLIGELEGRQLNRVPILGVEGQPLYIIHRSMIDKFIVSQVLSGSGKSADALSLADLLADPEMRAMFEDTFAVVKRQATLAEAKSAMVTKPGCSDVFVTEGGNRNEPVLGWLTNVVISRSS
jgi:hypothetical protein